MVLKEKTRKTGGIAKSIILASFILLAVMPFVCGQDINFQINASLNGLNTEFYAITFENASAIWDGYDTPPAPLLANDSRLFSWLGGSGYAACPYSASLGWANCTFVADYWNLTTNPRILYLVYRVDSSKTGTLNLIWDPNSLGQNYSAYLTDYQGNYTYTPGANVSARIDMKTTSSYSPGSVTVNTRRYLLLEITKIAAPNITEVITINETGTAGGTVIRGQNITINATVVAAPGTTIQNVWVTIWQNIIGGPILLIQQMINMIGNIWTTTFQTNYTWPAGVVNYTIYANETTGMQAEMNATFNITAEITSKWSNLTIPQGIFEPYNAGLVGTHANEFKIRFSNLSINPDENLKCSILESDKSLLILNMTGLNLTGEDYNLSYTVQDTDSIINDANAGYLPWIVKNCTIEKIGNLIFYSNITSQGASPRIYVHSPVYWDNGEFTRAVTCMGTPYVYFNNTVMCSFTGDSMFAFRMIFGNQVECFGNDGSVNCSSDFCKGIFFPICNNPAYFGTMSALTDDPNGYTNFTADFASYSTPVIYTRYANTSGLFKLRLSQSLTGKEFSITIYNLTNVAAANVYGYNTGGGTTSVTDNGDGTYNVAHYRFTPFTGTLDLTFNISFNALLDENRNLKIVIAYGTDTNQGNPAVFPVNFSTAYGLRNILENESTSATTELNGVCGDSVNNNLDYLGSGGIFDNSYDCYDPSCNDILGANQTNEFGTNKLGLCNYATETNCTDQYNNDYNDYTDCHDADCFHADAACPSTETICNDGIDNDWDYALSSSNLSSGQKLDSNSIKWDTAHQFEVTDCLDADCNNTIGGTPSQLCNFKYETNCSDNFNNDAMQLKDCDLLAVTNSKTLPTPDKGEYDCANYCRATATSQEIGDQCFDNIDNDWDALNIIGPYSDNYTINSAGGTDCRWGGYFGIASNYYPDMDCDNQSNSAGKQCQLSRERNCTDSFDNDFDHDASTMPHAAWTASAYNAYFSQFGLSYVSNADFDDYDCKSDALAPSSESLNASWCFDGIDNNLDAFYFNGANYVQNTSTGMDCADPTCWGITNPANPSQTCLSAEYNASSAFFQTLAWPGQFCADTLDNDNNGFTDCADTNCYHQFDLCTLGPCWNQENITWNSCFDNVDNDYNGVKDCADSNCAGMPGNSSGALCSASENNDALCSDGLDNNANGLTDCAEPGCAGKIGGTVNGTNAYCGAETSAAACFDGFDNNRNGLTDCMDSGCNSACSLSTIAGTIPISLPQYSGQIALDGISTSVARIDDSTSQVRNGEWYNITLRGLVNSGTVEWALGAAVGGVFNKTAFNASTAFLSGPDAGTFTLSESPNGWVIDSTSSHPSGYTVIFNVKSQAVMPNNPPASSTYRLGFTDSQGSLGSFNNYINYASRENTAPAVQSIEFVLASGNVPYGSSVYIRANASDNNALGLCSWKVYGADTFDNIANSTSCTGSFMAALEGTYYINATPVDYYSNTGLPVMKQYNLNLIPASNSISLESTFYNQSQTASLNATFNVAVGDSLGNCQVIAANSSGAETMLANFLATGNSCYSASIDVSSLSDDVYKIRVRVTETTEGDVVDSASKAMFVCSQTSSGICKFADFNGNGKPDVCPACTPDCAGKNCGDNGCGGSCGTCGSGQSCNNGVCQGIGCSDTCSSKGYECGTQTICSASVNCGSCNSGYTCSSGSCVCTPDCGDTSQHCAGTAYSNGCPGGELACTGTKQAECPSANNVTCGNSLTSTNGCGICIGTGTFCPIIGQSCQNNVCAACIASCAGKACGDDGCGGSCGTCPEGQTCAAGSCTTGTAPITIPVGLGSASGAKEGCLPAFACGDWGACEAEYDISKLIAMGEVSGIKTRLCIDNARCLVNFYESENCSLKEEVTVENKKWCSQEYTEVKDRQGKVLARLQTRSDGSMVNVDLNVGGGGYCYYCFDGIKNYDETGIDCGGSCITCTELEAAQKISFWDKILRLLSQPGAIFWIALIIFLILVVVLFKLVKGFRQFLKDRFVGNIMSRYRRWKKSGYDVDLLQQEVQTLHKGKGKI